MLTKLVPVMTMFLVLLLGMRRLVLTVHECFVTSGTTLCRTPRILLVNMPWATAGKGGSLFSTTVTFVYSGSMWPCLVLDYYNLRNLVIPLRPLVVIPRVREKLASRLHNL